MNGDGELKKISLDEKLLKESKDTFLTIKRLAKKLQNKLIIK